MSERTTHAYCPTCKEQSAIDSRGRCLWCEGPTERKAKRGGWKRPDLRGSKYTDAQLRALHVAHMRGASANSLARQTYEKVGYASSASALSAILREWRRLGLKARDRIEATVKASTIHGMAPKHGPRPGYGTYRRRVVNGQPDQPTCEGLRTQPPRKGDPCDRPAMRGSRFCFAHDPANREAIEDHTAQMREQLTYEPLPMEPFRRWLLALHAEHGTWRNVAAHLGLTDPSMPHRFATAEKQTIEHRTVEKYAEAGGTTVEAIYEESQVAA